MAVVLVPVALGVWKLALLACGAVAAGYAIYKNGPYKMPQLTTRKLSATEQEVLAKAKAVVAVAIAKADCSMCGPCIPPPPAGTLCFRIDDNASHTHYPCEIIPGGHVHIHYKKQYPWFIDSSKRCTCECVKVDKPVLCIENASLPNLSDKVCSAIMPECLKQK